MPSEEVYVSSTGDDWTLANRLKQDLRAAGVTVALDRDCGLYPAQVKKAISSSQKFIICFAAGGSQGTRYESDDLTYAIEQMDDTRHGWLLCVKLTICAIPPLPTINGNLLTQARAFDLSTDWNAGVARLLAAIGMAKLTTSTDERIPTTASRVEFSGNKLHIGGKLNVINDGSASNAEMVAKFESTAVDNGATFGVIKPTEYSDE